MESEIEKSIETIMKIDCIEIRQMDFDNLIAIGIWREPLKYLYRKEGWSKFSAYDESKRLFIMSLFTNPMIAREDWLNMASKEVVLQKINIASRFTIGLVGRIEVKPPKNLWWRLKNMFGTFELDHNNISYQILPESLGNSDEMHLWSSCKAIPIYKGNWYHELVINESRKMLEEK